MVSMDCPHGFIHKMSFLEKHHVGRVALTENQGEKTTAAAYVTLAQETLFRCELLVKVSAFLDLIGFYEQFCKSRSFNRTPKKNKLYQNYYPKKINEKFSSQ